MSTPIQLIVVVAIAAALVIKCESLQCYVYNLGVNRMEMTCKEATYCGKAVGKYVSAGLCDDSNGICSSNGCRGDSNGKVCCCDTDLCNTGNFVTSTLTATAVSLIFVFFSRYITY
jgi:hypothetical protein